MSLESSEAVVGFGRALNMLSILGSSHHGQTDAGLKGEKWTPTMQLPNLQRSRKKSPVQDRHPVGTQAGPCEAGGGASSSGEWQTCFAKAEREAGYSSSADQCGVLQEGGLRRLFSCVDLTLYRRQANSCTDHHCRKASLQAAIHVELADSR